MLAADAGAAFAAALILASAVAVVHLLAYLALLRQVSVDVDGERRNVLSCSERVSTLLNQCGVALGPLDMVRPRRGGALTGGESITVVRVREELEEVREVIRRFVALQESEMLHKSETIMLREGGDGLRSIRYLKRYHDGRLAAPRGLVARRTLVKSEAMAKIVGTSERERQRMMPKAQMRVSKRKRMTATAYTPGAESCGRYADGYTSQGQKAGYGVAAVDPGVIRLGSDLYIVGYGYAVAADVGGAIKRDRIDLCFDDVGEAMDYGRKKVKVFVLQ